MINKALRTERVTPSVQFKTMGIVVARHELEPAITRTKNGAIFNYEHELPIFIRKFADRAQAVGRMVCGNDCQMNCVGMDLTKVQTPISQVDADFTARCAVDCSNLGLEVASAYFKDATFTI